MSVEVEVMQGAFDYGIFDTEDRVVIQQRTVEIKSLLGKSAQIKIEIGDKLRDVQERMSRKSKNRNNNSGGFLQWLKAEFAFSERDAYNCIELSSQSANFANSLISNAPITALYALSAKSTPVEAVEEVNKLAESGERVSLPQVQEIIKANKPKQQPLFKSAEKVEVQGESDYKGQTVEISQQDGDIVYGKTSTGATVPFLPRELAGETESKPQVTKPRSDVDRVELLEYELQVAKDRINDLETWIVRAMSSVSDQLRKEAEEMGL